MFILGLFAINQSPSNSACNNELAWAAKKTASFHSFPPKRTLIFSSLLPPLPVFAGLQSSFLCSLSLQPSEPD